MYPQAKQLSELPIMQPMIAAERTGAKDTNLRGRLLQQQGTNSSERCAAGSFELVVLDSGFRFSLGHEA